MISWLAVALLACPGLDPALESAPAEGRDRLIVRGRVTDSDSGDPVPRARVVLFPGLRFPMEPIAETTSGPDGFFEIERGPYVGRWRLHLGAEKDGYAFWKARRWIGGAGIWYHDVALRPGGVRVHGTVFRPDGVPATDAHVAVRQLDEEGRLIGNGQEDRRGWNRTTPIVRATWVEKVNPENGTFEMWAQGRSVHVFARAPGFPNQVITLDLPDPSVGLEVNHSLIQTRTRAARIVDTGGQRVAGAQVTQGFGHTLGEARFRRGPLSPFLQFDCRVHLGRHESRGVLLPEAPALCRPPSLPS